MDQFGFYDSKVCPPGLPGQICRLIEHCAMPLSMIVEQIQGCSEQEIKDALDRLVESGDVTASIIKFPELSDLYSYKWDNYKINARGHVQY